MTHKRHLPYDELFDSLDDIDGFDGFIIETLESDISVDDPEETWYRSVNDDPYCPFGAGGAQGLCVLDLHGCHYEGCDKVVNEW